MTAGDVKPWLEIAYYLSGVAVAAVAGFGLQQIRLLKRDMLTRNERAAKEKAIEYCHRYLTQFVPAYDEWSDTHIASGLRDYAGAIGDFSLKSLSQTQLPAAEARFMGFHTPMNELLAVAAAFTSGVADEKLGFQTIGRTFCTTVRSNYDLFCLAHCAEECPYYSEIVALYRMWAPRLRAAELEREHSVVLAEIKSHPSVKSIGT